MKVGNFDGRPGQGTTGEWLESLYLEQVAARVGHQCGLGSNDLPDLVQDVRIALWEASPAVRVGRAWVLRVATNKSVDLIRRRSRARAHDRLAATTAAVRHDEELEHLLHVKTDALPPRLRAFYDLHYRKGLSEREIARRLGTCRASVRWLDGQCRRLVTEAAPGGPARGTAIRK